MAPLIKLKPLYWIKLDKPTCYNKPPYEIVRMHTNFERSLDFDFLFF